MENKILKFSSIPIYVFYAYLLGWQIYYFNQEVFYSKELSETNGNFFKYMPTVVLLLYAVLLYGNMVLKQRKVLVFNSLFASSILHMYNTTSSLIMAVLLSVFGLIVAVFELKRSEHQYQP